MSFVYVYDHGAQLSMASNRLIIDNKKQHLERSVPIEGIESVLIIGEVNITSPCIKELLRRGINLTFLSATGEFFGRLESTAHMNIARQMQQFSCHEDGDFSLKIAAEFVRAKVKNQITLLRRYERNARANIQDAIVQMKRCVEKLEYAKTKDEAMGLEGYSAKLYFKALGALTSREFEFCGRTRRPPTDPFNSLLSFAYTLLLYDVYTAVSGKGLNPYISCMHALKPGHPALCSDLMEEWRSVIADSLVMYVISKGIIQKSMFESPDDSNGVYLKPEAAKVFIGEYEKKMRTQAKYLPYADFAVSFRRAIEMQAGQYVKAIEERNPNLYKGVVIR